MAKSNGNHVIGKWKSFKFVVSQKQVCVFQDLSIKASMSTEEKKSGGKSYAVKKTAKPFEVSMTVKLVANLGCNVQRVAKKLARHAHNGNRGYFYIGKRKLLSLLLMLTDATVDNVVIGRNGAWLSADVKLTFKQTKKFKKKKRRRRNRHPHTSSPAGSSSPTTTGRINTSSSGSSRRRPSTQNSTQIYYNAHAHTAINKRRPTKPSGGTSVGTVYNMYR